MSAIHLAKGSTQPAKVDGKLRLYSMHFCPFAERVRLVLLIKGIPHDIVNVHLKNKPDWIFKLHPEARGDSIPPEYAITFANLVQRATRIRHLTTVNQPPQQQITVPDQALDLSLAGAAAPLVHGINKGDRTLPQQITAPDQPIDLSLAGAATPPAPGFNKPDRTLPIQSHPKQSMKQLVPTLPRAQGDNSNTLSLRTMGPLATASSTPRGISGTPVAINMPSNNDELRYLVIQREYQKFIKKFNATSNSVTFKFAPVDAQQNPLLWLQDAFQELLGYILRNTKSSDRVGLVLRNHNFPEKPLGISFRRADQLSVAVILNVVSKVIQSNARFFLQDDMTLNVDKVSLAVGCGRPRTVLTGGSFDDFCARKYGIIVVPTKDNMCLASAIVIAIAFRDGDEKLRELKAGKVPVLDTGSQVIIESLDISDFLDEQYPEPPLYPKDPQKRIQDKAIIQEFGKLIAVYYEAVYNSEKKAFDEYIQLLKPHVQKLENELQKRGVYFGGDKPNMVDYMIWPWGERAEVLGRIFNQKIPSESEYPRLYSWCKAMRTQKAVQETETSTDRSYQLVLQYRGTPDAVNYDII